MTITVFLADDHGVVRDGLRALLEGQEDIEVVGDAADGREAVRQVAQLCPDVVVMDIAMPELNGIEAARKICAACPAVQVVILSMHYNTDYVFRALRAGARGYLLKESAGTEMVKAVRTVYAGHHYLSQKISDDVFDDYVRQRGAGEVRGAMARLSPREREILQFVSEGKSSAEVADMLNLSSKTVETYRSRLMKKVGVHDLPSLVKFAIMNGLTPLE